MIPAARAVAATAGLYADPGGLTLRAPLEDTADETDCLYFIGG